MPAISIIIPTWNHASALARCLASVEQQTEKDFEVIVVDDASTDGTARFLREQRPSFSLQTIRLPENRGAPAARNEGARLAAGRYLLFLDADVELYPDALAEWRRVLDMHPTVGFAYSAFRFGWKAFKSRPFSADTLKKAPYIHTTALMRRTIFPGFDERFKKFQDWDLWLTIAERGGKGEYLPKELFTVAVARQGISQWLPSVMHRLPWPIMGWTPREVINYRYWEGVIKQKHGIA